MYSKKEQQIEIIYNEGWPKQVKENANRSCEYIALFYIVVKSQSCHN